MSLDLNMVMLVTAGYDIDFIQINVTALALSFDKEKVMWDDKKLVVAIQFSHFAGHWLKNLASDFGVCVVFKYGNKLSKLPQKTAREIEPCKKSGHSNYVECVNRTVYRTE